MFAFLGYSGSASITKNRCNNALLSLWCSLQSINTVSNWETYFTMKEGKGWASHMGSVGTYHILLHTEATHLTDHWWPFEDSVTVLAGKHYAQSCNTASLLPFFSWSMTCKWCFFIPFPKYIGLRLETKIEQSSFLLPHSNNPHSYSCFLFPQFWSMLG